MPQHVNIGMRRTLHQLRGNKSCYADHVHSLKSSPLSGKFTIVGFFSSTNTFFVNRLKWTMM